MSKHPSSIEERLPTNEALERTIEKTEGAIEEELQKRGPQSPSYKFGKDTEHLLETSKLFLEEKNRGELIQKFFVDSSKAAEELQQLYQKESFFEEKRMGEISSQEIGRLAEENVEAMKHLILSIINSPEFRYILLDFIDIVKQIADQKSKEAPSMLPEKETTKPLTEETKEKAESAKEFGQKIYEEVKEGKVAIPEEQKQDLSNRLHNLLLRLSNDPNYHKSVEGLIYIFDQAQFAAQRVSENLEAKQEEQKTPHIYAMYNDAKSFLSNLAGEEIVSSVRDDTWEIMQTVRSDEHLKNFFSEFREYLLQILKNPDLLESEEYRTKYDNLYQRGTEILSDEKYKKEFEKLRSDSMTMIDNVRSEPIHSRLTEDLEKLAHDVFLDDSGKPNINIMASGLNNIRSLVAPILRKNLDRIYVGDISGSDDTYDWKIFKMLVRGNKFIPENVEMRMWGNANVTLTEAPSKAFTFLAMYIRNVELVIRDMQYHMLRKKFPKLEDNGIANVDITGKNQIRVVWLIQSGQQEPTTMSIYDVRCALDKLKIEFKETQHSVLMNMATTLMKSYIRRNTEHTIEQNLKDGLALVNERINEAVKQSISSV